MLMIYVMLFLQPHGPLSMFHTIMYGLGVAAFGDAKGAIVPAVLLISIVGILSGYNFSLLGRICSYVHADSYTSAWKFTIGDSTSWIPALACTCKTFLAVLAYSMVLAETFAGLLTTAGFSQVTRTQTIIGLTLGILMPLCRLKNLASLAPFSILGIGGMVLTVACMAIRYCDGSYGVDGWLVEDLKDHLKPAFGTKGVMSVLSPNSFILICMLSTAYMAHFNAPKVRGMVDHKSYDATIL